MKLNFGISESPWLYRLFWLVSIALFVFPAWVGWLDQRLVEPHVRFLQFLSPPLAMRWPGPIAGSLTNAHRTLFSIFYGMLGWICVGLVWHQFEIWYLRIWWILIYWLICVGFVEVVTLLLVHFRVMTG